MVGVSLIETASLALKNGLETEVNIENRLESLPTDKIGFSPNNALKASLPS